MSAKLFLGQRLRRLRRERELSQTEMAKSLAISPSYLNHLERNQRPVTAGLLLKLAELYDVDVRAFAAGGGIHTGADALVEIFSDKILRDFGIPRYELAELANNAPTIADAIARLYTTVKEAERHPGNATVGDARALVRPKTGCAITSRSIATIIRRSRKRRRHWATALSDPLSMAGPMRRRLKDAWGITTSVVPQSELGSVSQLYDADRRHFMMSSQLGSENRLFALAYQLAMVEFANVIDQMVADARPRTRASGNSFTSASPTMRRAQS